MEVIENMENINTDTRHDKDTNTSTPVIIWEYGIIECNMCRCHVVVGHRKHLQYEVSVLTARTPPKHNHILAKPVDDIWYKIDQ